MSLFHHHHEIRIGQNEQDEGTRVRYIPMRMKEGATRVSIHADSSRSLATGSEGREMRDSDRVVGIWRALIAKISPQVHLLI
jgi:predicted DCC family thiol-disulfide oxidoreductase YuxK